MGNSNTSFSYCDIKSLCNEIGGYFCYVAPSHQHRTDYDQKQLKTIRAPSGVITIIPPRKNYNFKIMPLQIPNKKVCATAVSKISKPPKDINVEKSSDVKILPKPQSIVANRSDLPVVPLSEIVVVSYNETNQTMDDYTIIDPTH